jgi:GLPGLI family protein
MKRLLLVFFIVIVKFGITQNVYSVIYEYDQKYKDLPTINHQPIEVPKLKQRLVFNDSMAFSYDYFSNTRDPLKKATVFGNKFIPHFSILNNNQNVVYLGTGIKTNKKNYLLKIDFIKRDWVYFTDSIKILGFNCRQALSVDAENDSLLVWFTMDIPVPFGPQAIKGLPGLVLEVFDQQNGRHIIAVKVEKKEYTIQMPPDAIIFTDKREALKAIKQSK